MRYNLKMSQNDYLVLYGHLLEAWTYTNCGYVY